MKAYNEFFENLKTLISFKTVACEGSKKAPFGEENLKALNFFLSLAQSMGFDVINYDNYAGEVFFGEGEEVGIIGHLDVVPTDIGWDSEPYTLTEKDGYLIARGIMDDKGPTLLTLYALKELKDSGIKQNKKFRLFVGCNEESGWRDLNYLVTKTEMPEYGFSPDGNFPLSYAEKGITVADFYIPKFKNFFSVKGGTAVNTVCAYCQATATDEGINKTLIEKHGLILKDNNTIVSVGKAAHGSTPHLGKNAIKPLLDYFADMGEDVKNVIECLFEDKYLLSSIKNEQGALTFSPDMISEEGDRVKISVDCRIPAPVSPKDVYKIFDKFGVEYTLTEKHPPMMVDKEGWFVSALTSALDSVTGEKSTPVAMGGSTFARCFEKGCAFGPDFNAYPTNIHDANERVLKSDFLKAYDIYLKTLFSLAEI